MVYLPAEDYINLVLREENRHSFAMQAGVPRRDTEVGKLLLWTYSMNY